VMICAGTGLIQVPKVLFIQCTRFPHTQGIVVSWFLVHVNSMPFDYNI
jgi:hypothetical protein